MSANVSLGGRCIDRILAKAMLGDQGNGARNSQLAGGPSASDKSHLQPCAPPARIVPPKGWLESESP